MSKHTAGPWSVCRFNDNYLIESSDGYTIGAAFDNNGWPINAENARLIAAAPELLEALCLAHDHLALTHESFDGEPDEVLKQIRSAIAKARGES